MTADSNGSEHGQPIPNGTKENGHANGYSNGKKEEGASIGGFDYGGGDLLKLSSAPTFSSKEDERKYLKERLVAAIRIFAMHGFDFHVAGHLTVRDPETPHHFWVNPFGLAFRLMTVSDLILVNEKGSVIGGGKEGRKVVNLAGFLIHSAIHKTRPDVVAICHSHSTYGKAFSTLGKQLDITTQDACSFYNDLALLDAFGGVVVRKDEEKDEGAAIANALGKKKAIILQNHGILTVGTSIDTAVAWFIALERQCQVQLLADAAAVRHGMKPILCNDEDAAATYQQTGSEKAGYFMASPYFQLCDAEFGDSYKK